MGGEGGRKRRGGRAREEPISAGFGTWGGLYVRAGEGAQGARWNSWRGGKGTEQRTYIFLKVHSGVTDAYSQPLVFLKKKITKQLITVLIILTVVRFPSIIYFCTKAARISN